jgi:hypothetical protein
MKFGVIAVVGLGLATCAVGAPIQYTVQAFSGGVIQPGTLDTGIHCAGLGCGTFAALPFDYTYFGTLFTAGSAIGITGDGMLQFGNARVDTAPNTTLPNAILPPTIAAFWDNSLNWSTCQARGCGVFTSVTGAPGSQVFNIEWRGFFEGGTADFEIRLFQSFRTIQLIFGATTNLGATATIGIQDASATGNPATQFSFDTASVFNGLVLNFTPGVVSAPAVPEPTSASMLGLGGGLLLLSGRFLKRFRK